ncbi:thioredoxin domain-containing protein [Glycomyces sp. A-F 0318]|nr:DUF255 domain-containing protein [Glycomyces amatae]MCD0445521.1 thioredoxin domain-containing protein [Glycomyces amatae]
MAGALSPYLRQHAANPVAWRQWSPEALADAARRDVPLLISIGCSTRPLVVKTVVMCPDLV